MKHYVLIVALSEDRAKVVNLKKTKGPALVAGRINFPGGHVEPGEEYDEAAARELLEETGLRVKPSELKHIATKLVSHVYEMRVYGVCVADIAQATTLTDEPVYVDFVRDLMLDWLDRPTQYSPEFLVLLSLGLAMGERTDSINVPLL